MKGVIFTSFLEMVEDKFGYETVDEIINEDELPSGGIYTAVGTYDHSEIVTLVGNLSRKTGMPMPDLIYTYGKHLFTLLVKGYGHWIKELNGTLELLEHLEGYIHVEVRKLYPEAELPSFQTKRLSPNHLQMIYHSERRLSSLALGLIDGCFEHYGEQGEVTTTPLSEDGSTVQFNVIKKG